MKIVNKLANLAMISCLVVGVSQSTLAIAKNHTASDKTTAIQWQLIPAMAKQFASNSKDRLELEHSTNAAISSFSHFYQKFGNWDFAVAAYNAEDGQVMNELQKLKLPLASKTHQYLNKMYQIQRELSAYIA